MVIRTGLRHKQYKHVLKVAEFKGSSTICAYKNYTFFFISATRMENKEFKNYTFDAGRHGICLFDSSFFRCKIPISRLTAIRGSGL